MTFSRKTFLEAKAAHKEMRRSPLTSKTPIKRGTTPMKRSRMKVHRQSPEDKAWREQVLERDGYRCRWIDPITDQRCVEVGSHVQAHHVQTRKQRPDRIHDTTNGKACCPFHHDYLHNNLRGRKEAQAQGMLGSGETYERAMKQK